MNKTRNRKRRWLLLLVLLPVLFILLPTGLWTGWAERNPEQEREFRLTVQERLHEWFPEQMALPDEIFGFHPVTGAGEDHPPAVILIHGLDEPGGIWDELADALDARGVSAWKLRYPNDQAIDHSADFLADHWGEIGPGQSVVLIGHSMGGLVIRDFVTRALPRLEAEDTNVAASVAGVIQVATPNQGSEWSRLRAWLEVRETFADIQAGRFSLFAGLRDGTGAAKIDLRPGSRFLEELNQRSWPKEIPIRIIGGVITAPSQRMLDSVEALARELGDEALTEDIENWWATAGKTLGDGAVPVESLALAGHGEPLILEASHRGLLARLGGGDEPAPAIEPILGILDDWCVETPEH
ncbi:MAG: esterase/lipase family protein [Wenzhouxiangella sp.]